MNMTMRRFLSRQNIIVFLMIVAILCGLYELIPRSRVPKASVDVGVKTSQLKEIREMFQLVATDPKENRPSARDQYVRDRAESGWPREPFFDRKSYRDWKISLVKPKTPAGGNLESAPSFNYTGYLEDKGKKIAIINGTEYMAGESLDLEGYILRNIFSSRVIIEDRASRRHFNVPFQE